MARLPMQGLLFTYYREPLEGSEEGGVCFRGGREVIGNGGQGCPAGGKGSTHNGMEKRTGRKRDERNELV